MSNTVYIGPAECHPDVTELPASEAILPRQVLVANAGNFDLAGADQGGVVYFALEDILEEVVGERDGALLMLGARLGAKEGD